LCQEAVNEVLSAFYLLGIPIANDKLEDPSQALTFLGIDSTD